MGKIPKPCKKREVPPDPSAGYLQRWKELFNSIDTENIQAYLKGDEGFPNRNDFEMNASRLSDWYNTDVQLLICLKGSYLTHSYGNEVYGCLGDTSFACGWIYEDDENYDSLREQPIPWKEMYSRLVEETLTYQKRIPVPPENV